jgi:16S rRNA (guanine527-N7)-methyltransferase
MARRQSKKGRHTQGSRQPARGPGRRAPARGAASTPDASRRKRKPHRPPPVPDEIVTPEVMGRLLTTHGFSLTQHQLELVTRYHGYLLDRNRTLNLTRILNLEDMVLKHYVDCFMVNRLLPDFPEPLLDIGSGAGFPGLPLKILSPDKHIILGEGVRKRVAFLRDARELLQLERLDIIGRNIDKDFEYPVAAVITRAVESIRDTLARIRNCLRVDGIAVFMKGPNVDVEIKEALRKYPDLYALDADHAYTLSSSPYKRRLVIFRKLQPKQ